MSKYVYSVDEVKVIFQGSVTFPYLNNFVLFDRLDNLEDNLVGNLVDSLVDSLEDIAEDSLEDIAEDSLEDSFEDIAEDTVAGIEDTDHIAEDNVDIDYNLIHLVYTRLINKHFVHLESLNLVVDEQTDLHSNRYSHSLVGKHWKKHFV